MIVSFFFKFIAVSTYEEFNRIFFLVGFFIQSSFDFLTTFFEFLLKIQPKCIIALSLTLQVFVTCASFLLSYEGLKATNLANLVKVTLDMSSYSTHKR